MSCSLPLPVKPLEKSPTYDIAEEDPSVYSDEDDFDVGFVLRREWKDVPLPSKPKEEDATFKYLAEAQRAHDFHVSSLAMHGIDACKVAKLSKATTVLENVAKDDRTCNICHKVLAGALSLKNHIRDGACWKEETLLQVMRPVFCRSLRSQDTQPQTWNRGDVSLYKMFQAVPISRTS